MAGLLICLLTHFMIPMRKESYPLINYLVAYVFYFCQLNNCILLFSEFGKEYREDCII